MNTRSPRVWLIDIREEIAGIQGLTAAALLEKLDGASDNLEK